MRRAVVDESRPRVDARPPEAVRISIEKRLPMGGGSRGARLTPRPFCGAQSSFGNAGFPLMNWRRSA